MSKVHDLYEDLAHDYRMTSAFLDEELERRINAEQQLRYERSRRTYAEQSAVWLSWIAWIAFAIVAALLGYLLLRGGL